MKSLIFLLINLVVSNYDYSDTQFDMQMYLCMLMNSQQPEIFQEYQEKLFSLHKFEEKDDQRDEQIMNNLSIAMYTYCYSKINVFNEEEINRLFFEIVFGDWKKARKYFKIQTEELKKIALNEVGQQDFEIIKKILKIDSLESVSQKGINKITSISLYGQKSRKNKFL